MVQENEQKKLVSRMLSGDERAFEEFFNSNFPRLFRFALSRLHQNSDAAEEVVQRALCAAITKLETYRGEAALFTWLCTFCRHEISAYLRARNLRVPQLIEDNPEVRAALESLIAADRPDDALQKKELSRLVQVVLDILPEKYARVLEWKYMEGLSVKEIAERMNVGIKAAESLLTRAREAFREAFTSISCDFDWLQTSGQES